MIRDIVRSEMFLRLPSEPASADDIPLAFDLLDTLAAHADECVGMAANMVGERKRVIVFDDEGTPRAMLNPVIVERAGRYEAREGCLSLDGTRPAARYRRIHVRFLEPTGDGETSLRQREETFTGWTAQVIQHEVDHCDGVVI